MNGRSYKITRIRIFEGRPVDSLNPEELKGLAPWLAKVQKNWERADDELRSHYTAIQQAIEEAGIQRESETPQRHLPESGASPQQSLKPQIPLAPLRKSETPETSSRLPSPAPIAARRSSGLDDVREREEDPSGTDTPRQQAIGASTAVEQIRDEQLNEIPQEPETSSAQSLELTRVLNSDKVLERLDAASAALDAANSLEEVKLIADIAAAAHVYSIRARRGEAVQNKAAAHVCRALAKLGRMMPASRAAGKLQKKGRPEKKDQNRPFSDSAEKPKTLAALGIDKHQATQARKLAKFPEPEFESRLKAKLEKHELSRTSTLEDPKQKELKPTTRQDCVKTLCKLVEVLANSSDESFDLESQDLDIAKFRAAWPKLMALMRAVRDYITPPPKA